MERLFGERRAGALPEASGQGAKKVKRVSPDAFLEEASGLTGAPDEAGVSHVFSVTPEGRLQGTKATTR